jgi:hypothetical protein
MPVELVSMGGGTVVSVPGVIDAGGSTLCGLSMREGQGGIIAAGLRLGSEVSSVESIATVVELSASAREGAVIERRETVPCKDRFFFSSSPMGYKK